MKRLTAVQWIAVVVSVAIIVAFTWSVVVSVVSSQGLPMPVVVGGVAFVIALVAYPLIRRTPRTPRDSAADRKDPK